MRRNLAMLGLLTVTIIWGGGFVASDIALESFAPFQIMTLRFLMATVLMGLASRSGGRPRPEEIRVGICMGAALFAGFSLQTIGLLYTTPSKNAFLTTLNVVMVPFIAWMVTGKRVGVRSAAGAVLSVLGVGILSLTRDFRLELGDLLTIGCAVGFAVQIYLTGCAAKRYRVEMLNQIQMATAFVLSLVCMPLFGPCSFSATSAGWLSLLYLGAVSTTLCYFLQTTCQREVSETQAAIILSLESVFATLFSILILGERVTLRMGIGSALILGAVLLSSFGGELKEA